MKYVLLFSIVFYQKVFSPFLKQFLGVPSMCKSSPSCSEYTRQMIKRHGAYGIVLGLKRLGECR